MDFHLPPGIDADQAEALLRSAMSDVGVEPGIISTVIVADDFGDAVARVLGHPEQATAGVDFGGKAIPTLTDAGVQTTVLLPGGQFRQLLAEEARQANPQLSGDAQKFRYAIRHEFGHAKDYRMRGITGHPDLDRTAPFRVRDQEQYNVASLLMEFAACAHSGGTVSPDEFTLLGRNEFHFTQHYREGMRGNLLCYLSGEYGTDNAPRAFKYDVAAGYWWVLIAHAKIFGLLAANPSLRMPGPIWDRPTGEIDAIFTELEQVLRRHWISYPRVEEGLDREITALWHRLMRAEGYQWIVGGPQEDALEIEISPGVADELQRADLPPTVRL